MKIDALFVPATKAAKPLTLPADQFEFQVDRGARRISTGVLGFFGQRETLRVQTNRPFEIDVRIHLPDTTMQVLRNIPCAVRVRGLVETQVDAARKFLETALSADFKFEQLVVRLVETAVNQYARVIHGGFVHHLREQDGHDRMQRALVQSLRGAGLPVERITIAPVMTDTRPELNFDDGGQPLALRSVGTLENHRVGFRLRLGWGATDEQFAGRLTYAGSMEGRTQGPVLATAAVGGQTQPLEHWVRSLLAETLSREEWSAVVAGDDAMTNRVAQAVSTSLGRGTGRVVQKLIVYPIVDGAGAPVDSTMKFTSRYAITGVKGDGIEVEHAIRYSLIDRDRWQSQGSPEPRAFFQHQVVDAAKSFLIDKRFEDVVALFLERAGGEKSFRDGIASRVGPFVRSIGYRLDSVATILAIPEMDFIHGRALKLPERSYGLADPHVTPALHIEVQVRVRQHADGGALFARALAMFADFEARVAADIEETVRARLRNVNALSYYSSPYVNGVRTVQNAATGEWHSLPMGDNQFHNEMQAAISASLERKFGLSATDFRLVPGTDALIERMGLLNRSSVTHHIELTFERGEQETAIRLKALATLFIGSISPEHWSSFHHNASRLTLEEHQEKIREVLEDTLRLVEGIVVNASPAEMRHVEMKERIVQLFMHRMAEELGLVVRLYPLQLTIVRPNAGEIHALEIAALKQELVRLFDARANLVEEEAGYGGQTRARLSSRIDDVKRELDDAAKRQEASLERTQTVRIEQDPRSGRLIEARKDEPPPTLPAPS